MIILRSLVNRDTWNFLIESFDSYFYLLMKIRSFDAIYIPSGKCDFMNWMKALVSIIPMPI
jgi:hypothetical protein